MHYKTSSGYLLMHGKSCAKELTPLLLNPFKDLSEDRPLASPLTSGSMGKRSCHCRIWCATDTANAFLQVELAVVKAELQTSLLQLRDQQQVALFKVPLYRALLGYLLPCIGEPCSLRHPAACRSLDCACRPVGAIRPTQCHAVSK